MDILNILQLAADHRRRLCAALPRGAHGHRFHSRIRPFPGRALVRGQGRGLLHRLRPRNAGWRTTAMARAGKSAGLPLGGYVKFAGDANRGQPARSPRRMRPSSRPAIFTASRSGSGQPWWWRGPVANFILAIFIFAAAFAFVGVPVAEPRVDEVLAGSASREGRHPGPAISSRRSRHGPIR